MTNRRKFIQYTGAALTAFSLPCHAASSALLPTRPIPRTGELLPIIGLGNSRAFQSGDLALSREILDIFMEKGGAYVDTSGPGRFTVGEIVRDKNAQDKMFLGTYISSTDDQDGLAEITAVREAQRVSSLDLILTRNVKDMEAHPDKFRGWKEDGLTRYLGVARPNQSFYEIIMKFMESGIVDFVQVNYSMLEPEAAERLLPMAMDREIAVIINRPFLNGQYFSIVKGQALPEWAAEFDCDTWAQFSLKFILAHPAVNCVLTETANPKHVVDNLNAGFGRLPDESTRQRMVSYMRDLASRQ